MNAVKDLPFCCDLVPFTIRDWQKCRQLLLSNQSELIMTAAVCFPTPYAICAPFLWLLQLNGFMFSNATLLDDDTYCTQKSSHPLAASAREILEDIREILEDISYGRFSRALDSLCVFSMIGSLKWLHVF